jgi:DNA replication protein DnaC
MVRYVIEHRDAEARIHSAREMVRMLRATWGSKDRERGWDGQALNEDDLLHDLGHAALLVIDEIGVGFGSDAEQVQLFDIIDARYKYSRPTVLLSNLPAKELKAALGERAYDRLREGAQVLACQWESHRGISAQPRPLEVVK